MDIPKKYFHDRVVLLMLSVNTFLVILNSILILLRLDSSRTDSYIVEYRASLGLGAYQAGGSGAFFGFIIFSLVVLVFCILLSMRIYDNGRNYGVVILGMSSLLLVLTLIVSNALLMLR